MALTKIPQNAVIGSARLARLPIDGVLALAGRGSRATSAKVTLDRAEATLRDVVGRATGDVALREDAARRRQAAAKREQAVELRDRAEVVSERAEDHAEAVERRAQATRGDAQKEAETKRAGAQRRRGQTKSSAQKTTAKRRQAADKTASRTKAESTARAKRDRLEALEAKAAALGQQEAALETADEARRLKDAATAEKAARKDL
ncbi:MAG: hypothetical protein H0U42_07795 [Thermoleophilaceae bacterium]|nr:hypothetical protein [Thermoleophilaceae bacterium]